MRNCEVQSPAFEGRKETYLIPHSALRIPNLEKFQPQVLVDDPDKHFHAERKHVFIDVETAAMEGIDDPLCFVAAPQPEEGPGHLLQVISEILPSHGGPDELHVLLADPLPTGRGYQTRHFRIIHQRGVSVLKIEVAIQPEG